MAKITVGCDGFDPVTDSIYDQNIPQSVSVDRKISILLLRFAPGRAGRWPGAFAYLRLFRFSQLGTELAGIFDQSLGICSYLKA